MSARTVTVAIPMPSSSIAIPTSIPLPLCIRIPVPVPNCVTPSLSPSQTRPPLLSVGTHQCRNYVVCCRLYAPLSGLLGKPHAGGQ